MAWYSYALISLVFIGASPLSQKWALNLKLHPTKLLIYTFVGISVCYLIQNLVIDTPGLLQQLHSPSFYLWGAVIGAFSMGTNIFMVRAIDKSPNPGYVLSIMSTSTLLTLMLSVALFGSTVTWSKLLGVFITLIGLYILLVDKGKDRKTKGWQISAVLAMIFSGSMILTAKQMSNVGITPAQNLLILCALAAIGFIGLGKCKRISLKLEDTPPIALAPVLINIILVFINGLALFTAIELAPNVGYPTAIYNCGAALTLLLSKFLFPRESGGEFNTGKWLGVVIIIGGVIIIILG